MERIDSATITRVIVDLLERNYTLQLGDGVYLNSGTINGFDVSEAYYIKERIDPVQGILWYESLRGARLVNTKEMIHDIIVTYEIENDNNMFEYKVIWYIPPDLDINLEKNIKISVYVRSQICYTHL